VFCFFLEKKKRLSFVPWLCYGVGENDIMREGWYVTL